MITITPLRTCQAICVLIGIRNKSLKVIIVYREGMSKWEYIHMRRLVRENVFFFSGDMISFTSTLHYCNIVEKREKNNRIT